MTLAELYAKLEGIEVGKDLIAGFKSEISKINDEANKGQKRPKSLHVKSKLKALQINMRYQKRLDKMKFKSVQIQKLAPKLLWH